ncbi:MAG: 50S ribosomal protein L11 methyltransferase [Aquificaceae bacterium]|nr:50S ribosomal protein L11 methyltransferase [Aquificaceae bacterium]MCX8060215.1 50S ribosomal protein L11 methyltransferase [Aquificaceae bacterium]MDW8096830.1 50S ribosomal protein L11 methyltransferase [Aquificaceae bacterium]
MHYTKYVYKLTPEAFYSFLADYGKGVEVLSEGESWVEFALYEPLEGLTPVQVLEVQVLPPERVFRPIKVKELVVLPHWLKPVVIRQGVAFGTGLHPSTRLCLELLQEFLQEGWSVLDVGTGTGILAIACKRLGAGRVVAIDTDPQAVQECRHNAQENCLQVECLLSRPELVEEKFDLLVANLELNIFREELPFLKRLFRKVGIFSGLYGEGELKEFTKLLGLKPAKIRGSQGWRALAVSL